MALSNAASSSLSTRSLYTGLSHRHSNRQSSIPFHHAVTKPNSSVKLVAALHASDPSRNAAVSVKESTVSPSPRAALKWTPESWKLKKALQLPDYPNADELESVLKTIEAFPPIVFAGEARNLEERLADAAVGKAFLLQGGDCAESFKEFNADNIRDTFRVLLQMSIVLTFGGQVPVIKVRSFVYFSNTNQIRNISSGKKVRSFLFVLGWENGWSVCEA